MKKLWDIFKLLKNYKINLYVNVVFNILNAILSLFTFLSVVPFLRILFNLNEQVSPEDVNKNVSSGEALYDQITARLDLFVQENGQLNSLMYMCLFIVTLAFIKNLVNYIALFSLSTIRTGIARDLRKQIYSHLILLPLSYFSNERRGDIISRMNNDLMEVEFSVIGTLEVLFKSPIMIILSLGMLFGISWKMTLFALIFLPISGFLISKIAKLLKNAAKRGKAKLGQLMSVIDETLIGMRIIKAFNGEDEFNERFDKENEGYFQLMRKLYKREYLSSPVSEFISLAVISILLYVGGRMVLGGGDNSLNPELFIGYLIVFSQIIQPAKAFSDAFFKIKKGSASIDRINEIMDSPITIKDKEDAIPYPEFKDSIELKNIRFSYENEEVIKGINLKINKGQTVALVGPSGGGKSTLANLIGRFYDVQEGEIQYDGVSIKDYKTKDVRAQLGVVTQDSILFNDSIASNITLGVKNYELSDVVNACRVANAEEFIKDLPGTYDFSVGDGGNKLSGGQKQRLSIARAVFKNPPILILDEATSALDTNSEKLVQEAINKLMENRTAVVIAHRLSTIQKADQIVVIADGKIQEQGTHESLLAANGSYAKLVKMQQFD